MVGARRVSYLVLVLVCVAVAAPARSGAQTAPPDVLTCVESLRQLILTSSASPGSTVNYTVSSEPLGHIDFGLTATGAFSDPLVVPVTHDANGNGRVDFVMRGIGTGTATLDASSEAAQTNTLTVLVDQVTGLTVRDLDDSALESNPNVGGGLRKFTDLDTPTSTEDVRRIKLQATTELGTPDLQVSFRGFDMDDPSPGDRTPGDTGTGDNNASDAALSSFTDLVDEQGIAEVTVRLTRQPGDNFRFFAGCDASYLNGVRPQNLNFVDHRGRTLPTPAAAMSDMVTVWRRLHLEVDTMSNVDGNQILGKVKGVTYDRVAGVIVRSKVTLENTVTSDEPPAGPVAVDLRQDSSQDEFVNGSLDVSGFGAFDVVASSGTRITISGELPRGARGASVVLVDDDDIPGGGAGDEGAPVPAPDTSAMASTLAPAYIVPVFDLGTGSAPFVLNLPGDDPNTSQEDFTDVYRFDNIAQHQNQNFWVAYLLGGYQFVAGLDDDPDTEEGRLGQTDREGKGSVVFAETIRDVNAPEAKCQPAGVAVHEIVHLFTGLGHASTGLMQEGCAGGSDLAPESLILMRQKQFP